VLVAEMESGSRSTRTRISRTTSGSQPRTSSRPRRAASAFSGAAPKSVAALVADGRWLLFDGASRVHHRSVAYIAGVDQESGRVTAEPKELAVSGIDADVSHAEWLTDSAQRRRAREGRTGRHVIFTVARDAAARNIVHRFASEHDAPGLTVSPDGRDVAFIAPAADGLFQVFRMPLAGGAPVQVTTDPSTDSARVVAGRRQIAFTVWSYDARSGDAMML